MLLRYLNKWFGTRRLKPPLNLSHFWDSRQCRTSLSSLNKNSSRVALAAVGIVFLQHLENCLSFPFIGNALTITVRIFAAHTAQDYFSTCFFALWVRYPVAEHLTKMCGRLGWQKHRPRLTANGCIVRRGINTLLVSMKGTVIIWWRSAKLKQLVLYVSFFLNSLLKSFTCVLPISFTVVFLKKSDLSTIC